MRNSLRWIWVAAVGMVSYTINGSVFWAIVDAIFSPVAVFKWLICHDITWAVLQHTFAFFGA